MGIQPIRKVVAPEIPDKLYFRIGDVARICEVPAYVLRFWETEFPQLKPTKGGTGQRLYRRRDVEMALRIKSLLYDQRYTIPGARQVFKDEAKARELAAGEVFPPIPATAAASAAENGARTEREPRISAMGSKTQAANTQVELPQSDNGADLRRRMQLCALRDEMIALLSLLETSHGSSSPTPVPAAKPMRPRLVLEPRPASPRGDAATRPEMRLLVREPLREAQPGVNQGDLFAGE